MKPTLAICSVAAFWALVLTPKAVVVAEESPHPKDHLVLPSHAYSIVDTAQRRCYDNSREIIYPKQSDPLFGQDAHYEGNEPTYRDNGDGTISDLVSGLMWQKTPEQKVPFNQAIDGAADCRVGGFDDWRLPSIKELYSLIDFSGEDIDPQARSAEGLRPFIDTDYFDFAYGDPSKGERIIDSQCATSTKYVSTTMHGSPTMFGVNFADGRIKGYPIGPNRRRGEKTYVVFYVRGNPDYGTNDFHDNGDGTVTDQATGLTWMQGDSGTLKAGDRRDGKLNWQQALAWAEGLEFAGHSDWRLPNAKELQSIVDYTRSPDSNGSAAIAELFTCTPQQNPAGKTDFGSYWTGTTHKRLGRGDTAAYVSFGRSQGWMRDPRGGMTLLDVHGAGAQRSDPKAGDPSRFPHGRGPQGDVIGIYNLVRPVRAGEVTVRENGPPIEQHTLPARNRPRRFQ
ncbi:hypothetical protein CA13_18620 [Planctomycetes bacterium CA13]|uniref:Lcl C-terminal domain-containing protein n=1 Tax=Novipirellula herctigrandis TaxID=2527986 RepID=A0A5C5YZE5_9BACT|nr:hypothetical protein CA13_18620 [Planctomycetes bacterium CA13]